MTKKGKITHLSKQRSIRMHHSRTTSETGPGPIRVEGKNMKNENPNQYMTYVKTKTQFTPYEKRRQDARPAMRDVNYNGRKIHDLKISLFFNQGNKAEY